MIISSSGTAPLPHPDLPDEIKEIYEEARTIHTLSPRGAAALLRLALQILCAHLGGKGKNINDDIGFLVKEKGLLPKVQQALDIVRVVGNNVVHPGVIDIRDTPEIANRLFDLINFIVEKMITEERELEQLYSELPESSRAAIKKRDGQPDS